MKHWQRNLNATTCCFRLFPIENHFVKYSSLRKLKSRLDHLEFKNLYFIKQGLILKVKSSECCSLCLELNYINNLWVMQQWYVCMHYYKAYHFQLYVCLYSITANETTGRASSSHVLCSSSHTWEVWVVCTLVTFSRSLPRLTTQLSHGTAGDTINNHVPAVHLNWKINFIANGMNATGNYITMQPDCRELVSGQMTWWDKEMVGHVQWMVNYVCVCVSWKNLDWL